MLKFIALLFIPDIICLVGCTMGNYCGADCISPAEEAGVQIGYARGNADGLLHGVNLGKAEGHQSGLIGEALTQMIISYDKGIVAGLPLGRDEGLGKGIALGRQMGMSTEGTDVEKNIRLSNMIMSGLEAGKFVGTNEGRKIGKAVVTGTGGTEAIYEYGVWVGKQIGKAETIQQGVEKGKEEVRLSAMKSVKRRSYNDSYNNF